MDGEQCDPDNYSGYFLEFSGAFGIATGCDIDLTTHRNSYGFPTPDGFSRVNECGLGAGTPGGSILLCWYEQVFAD